MSNFKKPMLAATIKDVAKDVRFPCQASLKLDGVRMIVIDSVCYSRSMKKIPNLEVQAKFGRPEFNGLDGELIVGNANAENVFNLTTSQVMTIKGSADNVTFHVFDMVTDIARRDKLSYISDLAFINPEIKTVHEETCETLTDLLSLEERALSCGYEGLMVRCADGYKQGRSTIREGYLMKLKRFSQDECVIISFDELMLNDNKATINEVGATVRSTSKSGLIPAGTLGSVNVMDIVTGVEFSIGSGFSDELRQLIWDNQDDYVGMIITYKYFSIGKLDRPRFPTFLAFRHEDDI
jgi:DNA ligase-1